MLAPTETSKYFSIFTNLNKTIINQLSSNKFIINLQRNYLENLQLSHNKEMKTNHTLTINDMDIELIESR